MKTLFCSLAVFLALFLALAATGGSAQAQDYPWCAQYAGRGGAGGRNCGFTSFQQCEATVSGIGGVCERNTQYSGRHYRPY